MEECLEEWDSLTEEYKALEVSHRRLDGGGEGGGRQGRDVLGRCDAAGRDGCNEEITGADWHHPFHLNLSSGMSILCHLSFSHVIRAGLSPIKGAKGTSTETPTRVAVLMRCIREAPRGPAPCGVRPVGRLPLRRPHCGVATHR